jgi:hypothetical protein
MSETADNLLALDLEYRLTIAHRINGGCECPAYFVRRREVLIPEVLKRAAEIDEDPVDVFADYARGVHRRHEAGGSPTTPADRAPGTAEGGGL